ncbi:MAG TPA: hypothetical protein VJJ26_04290 [Candidatus Babeliales bacterium]|nr:hypothetical protein [Candidatus Babeliales bacterium]
MNNRYFSSLLCITVLALAPACSKKQQKATQKEDVNTMIELDNTIFEMEKEINDAAQNSKF